MEFCLYALGNVYEAQCFLTCCDVARYTENGAKIRSVCSDIPSDSALQLYLG